MIRAPIQAIRGSEGTSPYAGRLVATQGTVTYVDGRGFGMEDLSAKTPGSIYVYTKGSLVVAPGDKVRVKGVVTSFRPWGADPSTPGHVQLRAVWPGDVHVTAEHGDVPEPITLGQGGLEVSPSSFEILEGDLVRIKNAVVVGAPNSFRPWADLYVVPDGKKASQLGRTPSGGVERNVEGAPVPIGVRARLSESPVLNAGARFKTDLVGHLVYRRFGNPQLQVDEPITAKDVVRSRLQQPVSPLPDLFPDRANTLYVGSLNVENKDVKIEDVHKVKNGNRKLIDDDIGDGSFAKTAREIAVNLRSPDIMALQEIQDNDGAEISDVVCADKTYERLIEDIVKAGGPRYKYIDLPPKNGEEGGEPGGNIRNGFLYNPKRVKLDSSSVRRIEDPAFKGARAPVVATFEFTHRHQTERVTVMSVHNKSKRGGDAETLVLRNKESEAINRWARKNKPKSDTEHLAVMGDRNAYGDEDPLKLEVAGGFFRDLSEDLAPEERYSSTFNGYSGDLDHTSVKTSVPVAFDLVHMNSDFDDRVRPSDHDGMLTAWQFGVPKKAAKKSEADEKKSA